jgi:hypothetical protein
VESGGRPRGCCLRKALTSERKSLFPSLISRDGKQHRAAARVPGPMQKETAMKIRTTLKAGGRKLANHNERPIER